MITRRITEAIAKQNWIAASIELLIVVIGIFLGLQASSWYEERTEAGLQSTIVDRLKVDFEEIRGEIEAAIESHQSTIDGLDKLQAALDVTPAAYFLSFAKCSLNTKKTSISTSNSIVHNQLVLLAFTPQPCPILTLRQ